MCVMAMLHKDLRTLQSLIDFAFISVITRNSQNPGQIVTTDKISGFFSSCSICHCWKTLTSLIYSEQWICAGGVQQAKKWTCQAADIYTPYWFKAIISVLVNSLINVSLSLEAIWISAQMLRVITNNNCWFLTSTCRKFSKIEITGIFYFFSPFRSMQSSKKGQPESPERPCRITNSHKLTHDITAWHFVSHSLTHIQ